MPRTRNPRPKADPISYEISDEITAVATKLMTEHEAHFSDLRQLSIAYVMVTGGRQPNSEKIDGVWARFMKAPPIWHALTDYDAIVWVRQAVWKMLPADKRAALIAHQLSHGVVSEKGALTVARHDLEDFAWVARHFGAWTENVEMYGKQLALFGSSSKNGKADPDADAFADLDAKAAAERAEREAGAPVPIRRRRPSSSTQPPAQA